ncbi:MAG: DUF4352 domain-containing protein [Candidatus Margulisbacteria bacterium]|nr:DUF4352 domain-containing protein [Candidatus Margulisiibacteriota bacterium]
MFCQKCGTQNPDDGKFCSKCGNDLKSVKVETERKGITGKLGKMGIPGFRSGKTWKMTLATLVYLFIGIPIFSGFIAAFVFGVSSSDTNTPSASQVKTSEATQQIAKIGDRVVAGDFAYTFNGMTTSKQIGEDVYGTFYGKKADGNFIILDVTIENVEKESKDILIGSYVKIIDDQGRKFEHDAMAEIYLKDEAFSFTQLQPGLPKRGKIVFDVPANINGKIDIASGLWSSEKKYVSLTK